MEVCLCVVGGCSLAGQLGESQQLDRRGRKCHIECSDFLPWDWERNHHRDSQGCSSIFMGWS